MYRTMVTWGYAYTFLLLVFSCLSDVVVVVVVVGVVVVGCWLFLLLLFMLFVERLGYVRLR